MPHQRLTCSGLVMASNTSCRGASNTRVSVISVSDGVVLWKVLLFAALTGMTLLLGFEFLQIRVKSIEACFPDVTVAFGPLGHFLQGRCLDAAWPPLGFASASDKAGSFEHSEVLRDGWKGHVERLGKLSNRPLPGGECGENRSPGRVGKRGKR